MAGQISESDQIKQFKEFLGTYNKLTENCFLDCVKDFTSREVKPEEQDMSHLLMMEARKKLSYGNFVRLIKQVQQDGQSSLEQGQKRGKRSKQTGDHVRLSKAITCAEHCLQKYLKMTQRISMRFQEYHIQQNEALAAKAGLLSQPR